MKLVKLGYRQGYLVWGAKYQGLDGMPDGIPDGTLDGTPDSTLYCAHTSMPDGIT